MKITPHGSFTSFLLPALLVIIDILLAFPATAQPYLLEPARVFDGQDVHTKWVVLVEDEYIRDVGPIDTINIPGNAKRISLEGMTLLPGLIEGHSHFLVHPYDEVNWNDQVLKESEAVRVARATQHAKATLLAGFTTVRDLGSEGAGYADVGLKQAIEQGIIDGPRMLVAGRAIVATGSYGPKGFSYDFDMPLGAEPADGNNLIRVVRDQIGRGVDIVKVYADYRWGPNNEAMPTFSENELRLIVETAKSSGRPVVAHAATAEGMRRAVLAGVETIEHGDGGTDEVFTLMAERGVALCPTLGAVEAIVRYSGWDGEGPMPARLQTKHTMFDRAQKAGVTMCLGSDAGVFDHGDNVWELELMVAYGMPAVDVLRTATSVNAGLFHLDGNLGAIKAGLLADLVAVSGDPLQDISVLGDMKMVMKGGQFYKQPLVKLHPVMEAQLARYPAMEVQDWYKLLHQAAMGNRHLGVEDSLIYNYMLVELNSIEASTGEPLIEYISPDSAIVRLNLRPFKAKGGDPDALFISMKSTWDTVVPSTAFLEQYRAELAVQADAGHLNLDADELDKFFKTKKSEGYPAVHHSERFGENYKPAYRVLLREFIPE